MSTLLVTWEIADPEHAERVRDYLDRFDCMRFAHNAYGVESTLEADALFHELQARVGADDLVYVFTLGEPWIGYGYSAMNDWLQRHLPPRPVQGAGPP